jgi:hypothetical protein
VFNSPAHDDTAGSLPTFLAVEARKASDGQLTFAATFGTLAAAIALLWRPDGFSYLLASGLTCGAFGLWGISDRLLAEQGDAGGRRTTLLRGLRLTCAVVGALAGTGLLIRILFIGLGTWIS